MEDECLDDPNKTKPGLCGCGNPEEAWCGIPEDAIFSALVYPNVAGTLEYKPDDHGNILPDFSAVGYKSAEEPIPDVPVVKTISAIAGDNRAHIQDAINEVAQRPIVDGFRGALLLTKGEYFVSGTISINQSGIVIRGEGNDESGTRVIATQTSQHDFFYFDGSGDPQEDGGTKVLIVGEYIPVGAKTLEVQSQPFRAGDTVLVTFEPKQSWIELLGMDHLVNAGDPTDVNWTAAEYIMRYKRVVKSVSGSHITLDAPIVDPIDQVYATGYVSRYSWPGKIENVGIENLRLISQYNGEEDEQHGWNAVVMNRVQDAWAKDLIAYYFGYSTVNVLSHGYRISILNCQNMFPMSLTKGGRKYSFAVNGQLVLVKGCSSDSGRHDFVGHARTPGPSAFVDCVATNQKGDIGPHHRWSTGILFDNIAGDGPMNVQNRMYSGTGHGWAGAQNLFWNSVVDSMIVQSPPDHVNWAIGNTARVITSTGAYADVPGYIESNNAPVWPRSLYEQQLKERLNQ
ncbi:MAG: hypothetical protein MUC50_11305 [Myxococcota bacterium]|nr:hypothetical protein [Myxococcota bacterium]